MEFEHVRVTVTLDLLQKAAPRGQLPRIYTSPVSEVVTKLQHEARRIAYAADALLVGDVESRTEQIGTIEL